MRNLPGSPPTNYAFNIAVIARLTIERFDGIASLHEVDHDQHRKRTAK
jgi:hypothetical protein